MLPSLPRIAVALALACSIGLHWGILQSIAWVGMIVSYSQEAPIQDALAMTFDGSHPCALCKTIAEGKQKEKKSEFPGPSQKLECSLSLTTFVFAAPLFSWEVPDINPDFHALIHAPPIPPPRTA